MNILAIGDPHAKPGISNERFRWLGNLIVDRKPDVVLNIGDWADMPSLSSYDKGKKAAENRRYQEDLDAVWDAQEELFAPIKKHNLFRKKAYNPRWVITLGNHENRINRAANDAPELYDYLSTKDLGYEENGWEVHPFKQVVNIEGINFAHYFGSGVMDRAISGVNIGRSLINKKLASAVQGHSHLLSIATDVTANNNRLWGISLGCYFEHMEDFVSESIQKTYWRGVVMLNDVENGDCSPELITMERIKKVYGD